MGTLGNGIFRRRLICTGLWLHCINTLSVRTPQWLKMANYSRRGSQGSNVYLLSTLKSLLPEQRDTRTTPTTFLKYWECIATSKGKKNPNNEKQSCWEVLGDLYICVALGFLLLVLVFLSVGWDFLLFCYSLGEDVHLKKKMKISKV